MKLKISTRLKRVYRDEHKVMHSDFASRLNGSDANLEGERPFTNVRSFSTDFSKENDLIYRMLLERYAKSQDGLCA